jgi:hypothetical protein
MLIEAMIPIPVTYEQHVYHEVISTNFPYSIQKLHLSPPNIANNDCFYETQYKHLATGGSCGNINIFNDDRCLKNIPLLALFDGNY